MDLKVDGRITFVLKKSVEINSFLCNEISIEF